MNPTESTPPSGTTPPTLGRRDFLLASASAGAGTLLASASAPPGQPADPATSAPAQPAAAVPKKKKTFFIVGGHIDDAEAGMGGMMIKMIRAGHRVVVLDVVGDLDTWHLTKGRKERTQREGQE